MTRRVREVMQILVVGALVLLGSSDVQADSPLTSTPFHEAYDDVPEVVRASAAKGELDHESLRFLTAPTTPLALRAAVVNAAGWRFEGQRRAHRVLAFLGLPPDASPERLRPEIAFVVGYVKAMDDYFDVAEAVPYLDRARDGLPRSLTAWTVRSLVRAQVAMDGDWCGVWREAERVLELQAAGEVDEDFRPAAQEIVLSYLRSYRSFCDEPEGSIEKKADEEEGC